MIIVKNTSSENEIWYLHVLFTFGVLQLWFFCYDHILPLSDAECALLWIVDFLFTLLVHIFVMDNFGDVEMGKALSNFFCNEQDGIQNTEYSCSEFSFSCRLVSIPRISSPVCPTIC